MVSGVYERRRVKYECRVVLIRVFLIFVRVLVELRVKSRTLMHASPG
jgi:hypothetical protein